MTKDLSRKVAEVMGWKREGTHLWFGPDYKPYAKCPDYAYDLNLAMELVEKWKGSFRVKRVDYGEYPGFYQACFCETWHSGWTPWKWKEYKAVDKDLAAAICKAGLRALEEEEGDAKSGI